MEEKCAASIKGPFNSNILIFCVISSGAIVDLALFRWEDNASRRASEKFHLVSNVLYIIGMLRYCWPVCFIRLYSNTLPLAEPRLKSLQEKGLEIK
jgi:hypothetical protein